MTTNHQTVLAVSGMSCKACVRHVTDALAQLPGVTSVDVQLGDGAARVVHDPAQAPVEALIAAVREGGYEASAAGG